jgi:hypothetical protein
MCLIKDGPFSPIRLFCHKYIETIRKSAKSDGVMVSVLALSAVDRGFVPWSGQTKNFAIGIYCFFTKHAALRSKSKDLPIQQFFSYIKLIFNEMMMRSTLF